MGFPAFNASLAWEITNASSFFSLSEHLTVTKPSSISLTRDENKQAAVTAVKVGVVTSHRIVWVVRITQNVTLRAGSLLFSFCFNSYCTEKEGLHKSALSF